MQFTILLALWLFIGVTNMTMPGGITIITYACVWSMLMLMLIMHAAPEIRNKIKKK